MNEATVSEQWSYKLPLEVEFNGRGSGSAGTESAIEQRMFCFVDRSSSVPFASQSFFVCALHTTPRSGIDIADLIFKRLLLTEEEYPNEPVVIAENLILKYLFE